MATLGELLFYIATQNEGSPRSAGSHENSAKDTKSPSWQVSLVKFVESVVAGKYMKILFTIILQVSCLTST
jgi:hypothetical protein